MAEINQTSGKHSPNRVRSKKHSTRIDMTPMVDLAFLLLTFFILTTSLQKAKVLELTMPEEPANPVTQPPINEKHVLTLILDADNKIYWRHGISTPKLEVVKASHEEVGKLLTRMNREIDKMLVLVKATGRSKYQNLVDVMDGIEIAKVERYCIVDITKEDEALLKENQ